MPMTMADTITGITKRSGYLSIPVERGAFARQPREGDRIMTKPSNDKTDKTNQNADSSRFCPFCHPYLGQMSTNIACGISLRSKRSQVRILPGVPGNPCRIEETADSNSQRFLDSLLVRHGPRPNSRVCQESGGAARHQRCSTHGSRTMNGVSLRPKDQPILIGPKACRNSYFGMARARAKDCQREVSGASHRTRACCEIRVDDSDCCHGK